MIYLDNSATTNVKPKSVYRAVYNALTKLSANPGRSGHTLSTMLAQKVYETREALCSFLNCDNAEHIVFTENCTDALNLAILGTFREKGHIICSCNDHNAISRPLFELTKKGLEISIAKPKGIYLTKDDILPLIKPNTYMVAINHCSNVNGDTADIRSIGELCAEKCIQFLVDGAQSAGHLSLDMAKNHIDMLALAPHKGLYAPQGVGVLAFTNRAKISPIRYGGTGTESESTYQPITPPECYESGTLPSPSILGLKKGLEFVEKNQKEINDRIEDLSTYILYELSKINSVKVYTNIENAKTGVIGFNIKDYDSAHVGEILSEKFGIAVRGGLHCAPLKHQQLKTTKQGIVRASLSYFNNFTECEKFIKAIKTLSKE